MNFVKLLCYKTGFADQEIANASKQVNIQGLLKSNGLKIGPESKPWFETNSRITKLKSDGYQKGYFHTRITKMICDGFQIYFDKSNPWFQAIATLGTIDGVKQTLRRLSPFTFDLVKGRENSNHQEEEENE